MSEALLLKAFRALGCSEKMILDALEMVADERQSRDRARSAKYRKSLKERHERHVTHVTPDLEPELPLPTTASVSRARARVEDNSLPHKKEKISTTASHGSRIPPDWKPSLDDEAFALEQGLTRSEFWKAVDEFRDYWIGVPGARGRKSDWSATWRNRARALAERKQQPQRNGYARPKSGSEQALDSLAKYRNGKSSVGEFDTFAGKTVDASYAVRNR